MGVYKSLMAAGESRASHSCAYPLGSTSKRLCLNWDTHTPTQLILAPALLEPLSLFVESVVSSVTDPRGHPTSTFLFETCSAGHISTSTESLSSSPDSDTPLDERATVSAILNSKAAGFLLLLFRFVFSFLK